MKCQAFRFEESAGKGSIREELVTERINSWLGERPNVEVLHVTQSESTMVLPGPMHSGSYLAVLTITVWYREKS